MIKPHCVSLGSNFVAMPRTDDVPFEIATAALKLDAELAMDAFRVKAQELGLFGPAEQPLQLREPQLELLRHALSCRVSTSLFCRLSTV